MQLRVVSRLALVLGLVTAVQARAQDKPAEAASTTGSHYNIMGPSTCAGWPKSGDISSASKAVPLNWTLGFLSGAAAQGEIALLDLIEPKDVAAWLTTYCQAHPTDALPVAAQELRRVLEAKLPPPPAAEPPMFFNPATAAGPAAAAAAATPAKAKPVHHVRRKPRPKKAVAAPAPAAATPAKPAIAAPAPAKPATAAPAAKPAAPAPAKPAKPPAKQP